MYQPIEVVQIVLVIFIILLVILSLIIGFKRLTEDSDKCTCKEEHKKDICKKCGKEERIWVYQWKRYTKIIQISQKTMFDLMQPLARNIDLIIEERAKDVIKHQKVNKKWKEIRNQITSN